MQRHRPFFLLSLFSFNRKTCTVIAIQRNLLFGLLMSCNEFAGRKKMKKKKDTQRVGAMDPRPAIRKSLLKAACQDIITLRASEDWLGYRPPESEVATPP